MQHRTLPPVPLGCTAWTLSAAACAHSQSACIRLAGAWRKRCRCIWGFPKIRGTPFGGPYDKDYRVLGSILGSQYWETTTYLCADPALILVRPACWRHRRSAVHEEKEKTTCCLLLVQYPKQPQVLWVMLQSNTQILLVDEVC